MLGRRSVQRGLFEADHLYLDSVGRDTFYGFLAGQRGQLFHDEEFAELYVLDNGCPSVPPRLLATALILQTYDRVSDKEAKARADFDLRWKVALGITLDEHPFAKSTLQLFRSQLILHKGVREVFQKSLSLARQMGYLKHRKIKAVLDTSNILGRGAVKDTYNLLADGIVKLVRVLAELEPSRPQEWVLSRGLSRYLVTTSFKGAAEIDWEDPKARQKFLTGIVADADRLLEIARQTLASYPPDSVEHKVLAEAAELLLRLLLQDVECQPEAGEVSLREGVARDRVVSVHDPDMRHGHKSKAKRFDGHKAAVAVDAESQLIMVADVLGGNAPDSEGALVLVEQSEQNAQVQVEEAIGDCAYGDGATRREFVEAGRRLVAKVPGWPNSVQLPKEDFVIDLVSKTCRCSGGQECRTLVLMGRRQGCKGQSQEWWGFQFDGEVCAGCSLRARCVRAGPGKGRTVRLHPQEALLQEARVLQRSEAFAPYRKWGQVAEHRMARLMQLGMRQARYFGRAKALYQLLMVAMVANLTLVATKVGLMQGRGGRQSSLFAQLVDHLAVASFAPASSLVRFLSLTHNTRRQVRVVG